MSHSSNNRPWELKVIQTYLFSQTFESISLFPNIWVYISFPKRLSLYLFSQTLESISLFSNTWVDISFPKRLSLYLFSQTLESISLFPNVWVDISFLEHLSLYLFSRTLESISLFPSHNCVLKSLVATSASLHKYTKLLWLQTAARKVVLNWELRVHPMTLSKSLGKLKDYPNLPYSIISYSHCYMCIKCTGMPYICTCTVVCKLCIYILLVTKCFQLIYFWQWQLRM